MMPQANDFREECDAVAELLVPMTDVDFDRPTRFKAWTINHIMQHLHFTHDIPIKPTNLVKSIRTP